MTGEVVGRERELQVLSAFLDDLAAGSAAALVLAGPAGSGKTTLLAEAAGLAADRRCTVLRTAPARSEVRLAFAGLADLLEPYLPEVAGQLAPPQARALRVALMLEDAPPHPPEPRLIAAAFRGALAAMARSATVLLVIDDVQWLDPASEAVVGFAIRRAEHEPVGLLCAQRTDSPGADLPLDLPRARLSTDVLAVGGLSLGALHRMLRARLGVSFSHPALRRIEAGSGGNPFIALEIGRALVRRGSAGGAVSELPVPETLSELVGERLGALAPDVVDALRLVAVIPGMPAGRYVSAGVAAAALDTAVMAGVLADNSSRLKFAHPLLAAAVAGAIPPGRRLELHAVAARLAAGSEERARHRALAAAGPSPAVARELTNAADAAAARGAPAAAAELYELAASLTPASKPVVACRCRLAAARQLALAGDMRAATSTLQRVAESAQSGPERADALFQLGLLREHDYPAAASLLERALHEAGDDAARTADIRMALADIWSIRGDQVTAAGIARLALADAERAGDPALVASALAQNFERAMMTGVRPDEQMLSRALALDPASGSLLLRTPPAWVAAFYHTCYGQLDRAEAEWLGLLARAEADGVEYFRAHVLRQLATTAVLRGDAQRAAALAAEGVDIAEQLDFPHSVSMLLYVSATAALQLGQADKVRELASRGSALSQPVDDRAYVVLHQALPGSLDLALGDGAAAAARLRPLAAQLPVIGLRPTLPDIAADTAEALIVTGDLDAAAAVMTAWAQALHDPVSAALLARCRALHAAGRGDLDLAELQCAAALDLHEQLSSMPLQRGRTLLALGAVQRRRKQRAAARATLTDAAAVFSAITAPLWAVRAQAELARIGGRSPGPQDLTTTERRVADLVARGLSNREVAAELFVTVRAVESSLTKIYSKLGLRSRTELAARPRRS